VNGRGGRTPDAGVTLIETVVAMTVMAVFMTIFTSGIVQMFRVANRADAVFAVQAQVTVAFIHVDREIRYAVGITEPASVTGGGYQDTYVEYLTVEAGGVRCTELRLRVPAGQSGPVDQQRGVLQHRGWYTTAGPGSAPWTTLATNVASALPFAHGTVDDSYNFQRLTLSLTAYPNATGTAAARTTTMTFTDLNSRLDLNAEPDPATDPALCLAGRSG